MKAFVAYSSETGNTALGISSTIAGGDLRQLTAPYICGTITMTQSLHPEQLD